MGVYRTKFRVDAPSEVVWDILADFERYSEWNPSVPSIAGELREGSTVSLTLAMPGRPSAKVKAQLVDVQPRQRLRWHGNVGADWLFAGDRDFVIEAADGEAVDITHVEDVRGALFPAFRLFMGGAIQQHHDGFNTALKQRSEELAAQSKGGPDGRAGDN
jgi:hypothetical protein